VGVGISYTVSYPYTLESENVKEEEYSDGLHGLYRRYTPRSVYSALVLKIDTFDTCCEP